MILHDYKVSMRHHKNMFNIWFLKIKLVGFVDSDYASELDQRKCNILFIFALRYQFEVFFITHCDSIYD